MASAVVEKTEEELRKELFELNRQQHEITERLKDPRGIRRGGFSGGGGGGGPRSFVANGGRQRGLVRPAERNDAEDQPAPKRRISSAVVKIEEGEIADDVSGAPMDANKEDSAVEEGSSREAHVSQNERKPSNWLRRDGNQRPSKMDPDFPPPEPVPRVLPKNEDPKLVSRNKRMLGQLLGTLEKFRKEDMQLSGSEAYMRRSDSLKRAEQRAREESERLRQQEREQRDEKLKRDLTLRARLAAKAEEKRLELLFLRWSEHHKKLANFIRTKAEPPIFYSFAKPLEEDPNLVEQKKDQVNITLHIVGCIIENSLVKLYTAKSLCLTRGGDKELESHRLERGPKTRKIPGVSNNEDEDVEDINVAEDDMMDDVLDVDDNNQRSDEIVKVEAGNGSTQIDQQKI
uniref:Pinin-like n=1 Tax=Nicotiana tabacum TaxID=4097 RepID=A0A1S3XUD3_TOBAC|nr:PREDICTED: pinin-like [Nicotiana tabacum]